MDPESSVVKGHFEVLQRAVERMASNSTSAKSWAVALTTAVLVVSWDSGAKVSAWLAVIPVLMFLLLDVYYLSLS